MARALLWFLSMDALDEMKDWLGYGPGDTERLRAFWGLAQPEIRDIVEHFYQEVQRHEGSARVLIDPPQVDRLKETLQIWLSEVLQGPHDAAYARRRQAIGRRHVEVGLAELYTFTAMHVVEGDLLALARASLDPEEAFATCQSLRKVLTMDLALMTGTYVASRERLQLDVLQGLLVEHLRVCVMLVDSDGVVRSATRAATQLLGDRLSFGGRWQDALPQGLLEACDLEIQLKRALQQRRRLTLPRVDVTSGSTTRCFRIEVTPLEHRNAAFLLHLEDLTDAVALEARMRRSEALAQLGTLSAAVAHELRNPLAGISGALQVITGGMAESEPHREILTKVEAEVRRLDALVSDLLSFARPKEATLAPITMRPLALEITAMLQPDWPEVRFEVRGEGKALADENQIRQILHNLLRNAVDAVEGRGCVRIELEDARVFVADDGPGIPVQDRKSIFEPFVTTKSRGTGLGLAISAQAAEAMDGALTLTNDSPLGGACFVLMLRPA